MSKVLALTLLASPWAVLGRAIAHGPHGQRNELGQAMGGPVDVDGRYNSFVKRHGRSFARGSEEYEERKLLFAQRAATVAEHNSRADRLWTAGLNHLADRTEEELRRLRGWRGFASPGAWHGVPSRAPEALLNSGGAVLPQEFSNWTKLTSLRTVVDQGGCGSCWAVTAALVLGAHTEIHGDGRGRMFSAQELLDCVPNPHRCGGDGGCEGATVELAFDWAIRRGLAEEGDTPYTGRDGACKKMSGRSAAADPTWPALDQVTGSGVTEDLSAPGVHDLIQQGGAVAAPGPGTFGMRAWERLPENKHEPLVRALVERGPVAVSVAADGWFLYMGGVFDSCSKDAVIDHAVTLIGIGVQSGAAPVKYWLVHNSWGDGWGESGRIRLLRHDSDAEHCGEDRQPQLGTGCLGGPQSVTVCGMCGILYDSVVPHFSA